MTDFSILGQTSAEPQLGDNVMTQGVGFPLRQVADTVGLIGVAPSDLTPSGRLQGNETFAAERVGAGIGVNSELLAASPFASIKGHAGLKVRGFSDFSKTKDVLVSANGEFLDLEPYIAHQSGLNAKILQIRPLYGIPFFELSTGTTSTGNCGITAAFNPIVFNSTYPLRTKHLVQFPTLSGVGGQEWVSQIGFITGAPALATAGMYFSLDHTSGNFFANVRTSAGVVTSENTGVTVVASTSYILEVFYDPATASTKFFINNNDTPVKTILNSVRVLTNQRMAMAVTIRKTLGNTAAKVNSLLHMYDCQQANNPGFVDFS
tara:strand:+ start:159 stop:1118 length:960 start_codon:yes stop_codon:yes gene_type:complete